MSNMDRNTYADGLIDAYAYIKYIPQLPSTVRKTMFGNADSIEEVLNHYGINEIVNKIKEYVVWEQKEK